MIDEKKFANDNITLIDNNLWKELYAKVQAAFDFYYDWYCDFIAKILEKFEGRITRNEIDHFIWFAFKEPAANDKKQKSSARKKKW